MPLAFLVPLAHYRPPTLPPQVPPLPVPQTKWSSVDHATKSGTRPCPSLLPLRTLRMLQKEGTIILLSALIQGKRTVDSKSNIYHMLRTLSPLRRAERWHNSSISLWATRERRPKNRRVRLLSPGVYLHREERVCGTAFVRV